MKVRKRPVVVDAWKIGDADFPQVGHTVLQEGKCESCGKPLCEEHLIIHSLEGDMLMCPDDWLIQGVNGEFYPCKTDVFEQTYDIIEDS